MMSPKMAVTIAGTIGSLIGSYLPVLWGGTELSFTSILLGGVGGIIGIVIAYQLVRE